MSVHLERRAAEHQPRGFESALAQGGRAGSCGDRGAEEGIAIAGADSGGVRSGALARSLEAAGATALSVLTDEKFFKGSLEHLSQASAAVAVPCLRKDFIVDPFQILEARAAGADAILLIVAALTDDDLKSFGLEAWRMGLDVLCEVHDREELERAAGLGFIVIGVNSRNLHTMQVQPETQLELAHGCRCSGARGGERHPEHGRHCTDD